MIIKVIAIIFVLFLIYILLFKKSRVNAVNSKKNERITDEMMECPSCKTYVSQKEAILSNGEFFCSKECLLKK